jgi:elongation factor Tu
VTGRIERGKIKVGEEVEIVGFRETRKTVVTSVEMFKKQLDEGMAGDNAGLLLRGIGKDDVERGMVLAKPGSIRPHTKFKAEVYILTKEEGGLNVPLLDAAQAQFLFRTAETSGVAHFLHGVEKVMPGGRANLTVQLTTPIAMEKGSNFKMLASGRPVASGMVLTAVA